MAPRPPHFRTRTLKLVDIVGARPQFIKLAPVLKAIKQHNQENPNSPIEEILVHTGQHYDYEMSEVFFDELGLKAPDHHLGVGSGTHGYQTGEMLTRIEEVLLQEKPDLVIVYGDTNTTLAGALVSAKLHIPVAHVEAGLRSFNKRMPEEINRVLTDHLSDLLFCPTKAAVHNLEREGFTHILNDGRLLPCPSTPCPSIPYPAVVNVGDVMYDAVLQYAELAGRRSRILEEPNLEPKGYALATVHRAENADDPERLRSIFEGLARIAQEGLTVVFPIHPRTRSALSCLPSPSPLCSPTPLLELIEPVSYPDMLVLEKNARVILTDSGGVQKGGYDTHDNFEFLAASGIEAALKVREDSPPNCGGKREEVVWAYLRDPRGWKKRIGYGQRWMAETFFSGFKRLFGEVVSAVRFERMVKEIELKVWVYNLRLGLAPAPALSAAES